MKSIVIFIEGGCIQGAVSDEKMNVYIVDYDAEGESNHPHLTKFDGVDCILTLEETVADPSITLLAKKTWETT